MSWPLASFAIVALVLAGGWLAYERRRPSARMAAVVAVMAALAALGRDAFAALPDVKPITAMTLVAGYALGPLPGFTVGAFGMLVSNFMLGQGPYTPWQMAAWGLVGLGGAVLGWLSRRRLGRLQLAGACALAAFAAKQVMNLYTWTLGASHTPAAFLAVAGQALSYDITDTVASFLFGLAFAPELARLLARMRARMEVTWEQAPVAAGPAPVDVARRRRRAMEAAGSLLALAIAAGGLLAIPRATGARAAQPDTSRQVAYLARAQNPDGGFGAARGQASTELYSGWVAIGLAAAGRDPLSLRRNGHTVLDSLRAQEAGLHGAGDLERTILALRACGAPVRSLAGGDPVSRLLAFRGGDGSFGHLSNLTSFAILALRAAGYSPRSQAVRGTAQWLAKQQNADGGFGFGARGGSSDVDDTAAAVQALVAAGRRHGAALTRAGGFLVGAQNRDGGYPQQRGGESNAQSTAWAIQGLVALGRNVNRLTRAGSRSPVGYLQSLVAPDGSVRYSRTGMQTPVWVTAQALTALAGKPLPIAPVRSGAGRSRSGRPAEHAKRSARPARRSAATPRAEPRAIRSLEPVARAIGAVIGTVLAPVMR